MEKLIDNNSQYFKVYSRGILTSLLLPKKHGWGCVLFTIVFLSCTLIAVVVLSIILFMNASKIFSNLGRYALTPTMKAIERDVTPDERTEFSNAYIKIFATIQKNGLTDLKPWTINAMTNLAASAKDHKISREECAAFVSLVTNGTHSVTNKPGVKNE
ncbi:MAG: hypothetical protein DRI44_06650 [Chlamydiae bacterium]|nr:MAG: hypothetical protein DRI44_06650 [Chlamydiota bacterium]